MLNIYDGIKEKDIREYEIDVTENRSLVLKSFKGLVSIRGWENEKIKITAVIDKNQPNFGDFESTENIDISIQTGDAGETRVQTSVPNGDRNTSSNNFFENLFNWIGQKMSSAFGAKVNYEIFVPHNYDVTCNNTNGHCYISDIIGNVSAKLANGNIEAVNLEGDIHLVTYSGKLTLSGIIGKLRCETYNGRVSIVKSELETSAIKSMNGRIMAQFIPTGGEKYRIKTMNGKMILGIPSETSASISLKTMSGKILNNIEGTYTKRRDLSKSNFTMGSGEADIAATTMNGNIYIVDYDEFTMENEQENEEDENANLNFKLDVNIPADSEEYKEIKEEINEALEKINDNMKDLMFFGNDDTETNPQTPEELNELINKFNIIKEDFIKILNESDFEQMSTEEKDKINRELNIMQELKLKNLEKDLQDKVASFKVDMKDVDEKFSKKLNTVLSSIEDLSEKLKHINIEPNQHKPTKTQKVRKYKVKSNKNQEQSPPSSEEETKMILKMLENGKITASEAEALLKAIKD